MSEVLGTQRRARGVCVSGGLTDRPAHRSALGSTRPTGAQEGGPCFGAAAMQGWRVRMEDAHVANLTLGDPAQRLSLFGVFDGHVRAYVYMDVSLPTHSANLLV